MTKRLSRAHLWTSDFRTAKVWCTKRQTFWKLRTRLTKSQLVTSLKIVHFLSKESLPESHRSVGNPTKQFTYRETLSGLDLLQSLLTLHTAALSMIKVPLYFTNRLVHRNTRGCPRWKIQALIMRLDSCRLSRQRCLTETIDHPGFWLSGTLITNSNKLSFKTQYRQRSVVSFLDGFQLKTRQNKELTQAMTVSQLQQTLT